LSKALFFDKNPQAIIKDTQSSKTLFIHRGETLEGAMLSDIQGNRVIFNLRRKLRTGEKMKKESSFYYLYFGSLRHGRETARPLMNWI